MKRLPLLLVCVAGVAHADRITVRVVDAAGETAYIEPGTDAGLAPGMRIRIGGREVRLAECTAKSCSIGTGKNPLPIGATGTADAKPGEAGTPGEAIDELAVEAVEFLPAGGILPIAQAEQQARARQQGAGLIDGHRLHVTL